ncbi:MAG: Sensor protein ZraS [Chlamydiae bacterium]|nr:Sensor protein ZraS [Chlamydiota bacterium]
MKKTQPTSTSAPPNEGQNQGFLQFILDHMAQGILYVDHEGTITVYNPSAERLLGKSANDVLMKKFEDVFNEQILGFSMNAALEGEKIPESCNISYLIENGRIKEEILEIEPTQVLETIGNRSVGLIILIRNVTEIRRLENIADRKNRLQDLGEMASTIGHEIRNPLGGIKGFASLLVRDLEDQPKLKSMAEYIVKGTDDLNEILTQLLNYSHPQPLQLEKVDTTQVIREVMNQMQADESVSEKAEIIYEGPEGREEAFLDVPHVKSVLINLIFNAAEAIENRGSIKISLSGTNRDISIAVTDDGPGIPDEIKKKIFRPFFSTKPKGNGFGLAESRRIVDSHNGAMEVQSELGKGTTFTITIPREHED